LPFDSTHYIVLYPQNGDRIVTIDSVTSLHRAAISPPYPTSALLCYLVMKLDTTKLYLKCRVLFCEQTHKAHPNYQLVTTEPCLFVKRSTRCTGHGLGLAKTAAYSVLSSAIHVLDKKYQVCHGVSHCIKIGLPSLSSSGLISWIPQTGYFASEHIRFYSLVFLF